jgi:signal transduction histidine kinase
MCRRTENNMQNVSSVRNSISRTITISFFVVFVFSIIAILFVHKEARDQAKIFNKQQIHNIIKIYQIDLSEKIAILVSSCEFIDFIRSGPVSRKYLQPALDEKISLLKSSAISGFTVKHSETKTTLLNFGKPTLYKVVLKLCYFNDNLNNLLGNYHFDMVLFLNKKKVMQELKYLDKNITITDKNIPATNFFFNNKFGSFDIANRVPFLLNLRYSSKQNPMFLYYIMIIFITLVIFVLWNHFRLKSIFNRYIAIPVRNITDKIKYGEQLTHIENEIQEFFYLVNQIKNWQIELDRTKQDEKLIAIGKVAAQVSHDIRSPLAALSTVLNNLSELPEQKRILIRNATDRISDIANNLLSRYRIAAKQYSTEKQQMYLKPELVSSLLDLLISEKRVQMMGKSIDLVLKINNDAYGCFVKLDGNEFKRVISNLTNNATEAILGVGTIRVSLTKENDTLVIKIVDNGSGIPSNILSRVKQGGVSINKKGGSGLGIAGAVRNIKRWGGEYDIQSKQGTGTTFIIRLPVTTEPKWFQGYIDIEPNTHLIVLDDDESIHNIWEMHFKDCLENRQVTIDHFYSVSKFLEYCKISLSNNDLFLVDHELIGFKETGLDLVEQLDLKNQAILVTSRYEKQEIRKRVEALGIKIIPKDFAPYIPISMIAKSMMLEEQLELIFIDDDKNLTIAWEQHALLEGKKIKTFNSTNDFKETLELYNKEIPIYIDSDLNETLRGEEFAKYLYDKGFHNLYLATGYDKSHFGNLPWIKEIVSKRPPF